MDNHNVVFSKKKLALKPPPTSATLPVIQENVRHKSSNFFVWNFQVLRPTPNDSWGQIGPNTPAPPAATWPVKATTPPVRVLEVQSRPVHPGCTGMWLGSGGV